MIKLSEIYFDQGTFTGRAIKFAREKVFAKRFDVKKVFLVITDGKADDPEVLVKQAKFLPTEKIIVSFMRFIYLHVTLFLFWNVLSIN